MNLAAPFALLLCVGCTAPAPNESRTAEATDHDAVASKDPGSQTPQPPPEQAPPIQSGMVVLEVAGFENAVVSLPARAVRKEPLLVAVHGAGDGPEWECGVWRGIVGERGVILCPAGKPLDRGGSGHFHPDHYALERLVIASTDALFASMPERVDRAGPIVYSAYSQGATMGALMIVAHAARYPRLVLVEGGYGEWNVARGREFKKNGGDRVLFACGTRHCDERARRSATWLEKASVGARVVTEPGAGHTYAGAVAERVRDSFGWVVEGDNRWE